MVHNQSLREKVAEIQAEGKSDREWWEHKRATIQSNFMKELDEDTVSGPTSGSTLNSTPSGLKSASTPAEKAGSDEDTVLVEGGGPATSGSAKGNTKKKKGKK